MTLDFSKKNYRRVAGDMRKFLALLALIGTWALPATPQTEPPLGARNEAARTVRPMILNRTQYHLRAGEAVGIEAPRETLDFMLKARSRSVRYGKPSGTRLVVGPGVTGTDIILAASLTADPGEYTVQLSAMNEAGEERVATLDVVLSPLRPVPSTTTNPPLVLLNGWQSPSFLQLSVCPISTGTAETFGSLPDLLTGVPVTYFFDNCVECPSNCTIEDLGNTLGRVLSLIRYDTGGLVPLVDLVGHSMGGLIIRSYLAGLQTGGSVTPPSSPRVRKAVFIGTPHFGSFKANTLLGLQSAEMIPASGFLWYLATWNQGSMDDLRGVDALAIIGNKGTWSSGLLGTQFQNASDGVVSVTSASLSFARDNSRTRVLPYCHTESNPPFNPFVDCSGYSVAKVSETWNAIQSFLSNTSDWMGIGSTPAVDFGTYSGVYVGAQDAAGKYLTDLTQVKLSGTDLTQNPQYALFSGDFLASGQATVLFTSSSIGQWQFNRTARSGTYTPFRLKLGPFISLVTPFLNVAGKVVASGGAITISGYGFGQQRCANCQVLAYPGPSSLQVSSWTDSVITANLPTSYAGLVTLVVQVGSQQDVVNIMAGAAAPPVSAVLGLDRSQLNFGVTTNGASVTSSQVVHVTTAAGVAWNVGSNQSFVAVNPASGTGPGSFTVSVQSGGLTTPGNLQANVSVTSSGVSNSPQNVLVNVSVLNPSNVNVPFGSFDTPVTNATGIAGAIPITGWALDQIEVTNVDILREPVVGEPPGNLIFVGTAVFVSDARPDVQSMFSTYPYQYRAGWGYQMLTNFLPNASGSGAPGNGTYKIHAIAHDRSGQTTDLGTKTIGVDNAHAAKPFGSIDTPTQGGTISGSDFVNFAWALTQQPNMIPNDGSTITVVIDGAVVGHPTYNNYRSDISTLFPNYANSGGAVGFFHVNTTTLANGVHTISWNVFDNGGRGDGIGSRYFNVFNAGGPVAAPEEPGIATPETVTIRRGINPDRETEPLSPDDSGRYIVSMEELSRIELQLGATRGYLMVNGERHALPLGSTLKNGLFQWQAGVAYFGQYELYFEQASGGTATVWVTITPKTFHGL
jgi:pimeloyl-ACP methyl ester carboxylesterase